MISMKFFLQKTVVM